MANLNKVFLMGNLTRDPELRYTPSGTALVEFGMALNRTWKDQSGAKKDEVTFVDVQAWARSAEVISEYCKKGSPIFVEGRLKLDSWEGKDGQKRSRMRVVVENFQFIGAPSGRRAAGAEAPTGQPARAPAKRRPEGEAPAEEAPPEAEPEAPAEGQFKVSDDIPF